MLPALLGVRRRGYRIPYQQESCNFCFECLLACGSKVLPDFLFWFFALAERKKPKQGKYRKDDKGRTEKKKRRIPKPWRSLRDWRGWCAWPVC
ncbi:MAG TPA: hypothetical protein VF897_05535 [Roseiflexaceae bacterium]